MLSEKLQSKAQLAIKTQKHQEIRLDEDSLRQLAKKFGWKMVIVPAKKDDRPKLVLADKFGNEFEKNIYESEGTTLLFVKWDIEVVEGSLVIHPKSNWEYCKNWQDFLKPILKDFGLTQICVATEPLVQIPVPAYVSAFSYENWVAAGVETPWMEVSEAREALDAYHKSALEQITLAEQK